MTDPNADAADPEGTEPVAADLGEATEPRPAPPRRVRSWLAAGAVGLLSGALLALMILMFVQHQRASAQRARDAEFTEAARTGTVALLSIDHRHARADVQRVLDLSTGSFHDDFQRTADDFVKTAEAADALTVGSVNATALESVQDDTAVVIVAAASQVTNANGARADPRPWRMSVTLTRDGGGVKMSGVEFVP